LRITVSSGGEVVARDASLASANDNPATPRTGTALLRRFRLEFCFVRDMGNPPRLAAFCRFSRCTIGLTCSVLPHIDKEGGDSLFAKRFGGLQPVQTLYEYITRTIRPYPDRCL
jgi:hypothetical protein